MPDDKWKSGSVQPQAREAGNGFHGTPCSRKGDKESGNSRQSSLPTGTRSGREYTYLLAQGQVVNGCYTIESVLGHGGMGEVYLAKDISLQRQVAIKVLLRSIASNKNNADRFLTEARLQANLKHDSIITVYVSGYDEKCDVNFIAMEFVDGEALNARLKRGEVYSEVEALEICLKVARAMGSVRYNDKPVVHRDIKPANIMISKAGEIKIADWGIARIGEAGRGNEGVTSKHVLGTPAYVAPEQIQYADSVDARADIYSLGVTLYELLTGKRPFQGKTSREIIEKSLNGKRPDIKQELPMACQATVKILGAMMSREREKRPRDWAQLAERLQKAWCEALRRPKQPVSPRKTEKAGHQRKTWWVKLLAVLFFATAAGLFLKGDGCFVRMRNSVKELRLTGEQKLFFRENFREIPWELVWEDSSYIDSWITLWKEEHGQ